jgi:hypothetical protein
MNTGLPTAPLASGLLRAGGGAVDNPCITPDSTVQNAADPLISARIVFKRA